MCIYIYIYTHKYTDRPIGIGVECMPIVQETEVQSQVESYQRLKKNGTGCHLS